MACCCELQNTLDVEVTQDALLDVEIGGSAGVLLQAKSVEITENGTSVVAPDDGFDGLKSVEINTNVPKRFECGDAVFDTKNYNGNYLYKKITKVNVSCLVTAQTTSLLNLFNGFGGLKEVIGLENWDTSSVTDMSYMFRDCSSLQQIDVSNWDTSSVTNMDGVFFRCRNLTHADVIGLNTSKVKRMANMFYNTKLNSLDLTSWDTSNVTIIGGILTGSSIIWLDISYWNAQNFANTNNAFNSCLYLKTLIGDKTLQDVEDGVVTLRGLKVSISTAQSPLRFSSILALANGLADLTGSTAQTLTISSGSYKNMYNDDDTVPTADVIEERKARIAAICAAKNWNFAH